MHNRKRILVQQFSRSPRMVNVKICANISVIASNGKSTSVFPESYDQAAISVPKYNGDSYSA